MFHSHTFDCEHYILLYTLCAIIKFNFHFYFEILFRVEPWIPISTGHGDDGRSYLDDGRSYLDDGRSYLYDGRSYLDECTVRACILITLPVP